MKRTCRWFTTPQEKSSGRSLFLLIVILICLLGLFACSTVQQAAPSTQTPLPANLMVIPQTLGCLRLHPCSSTIGPTSSMPVASKPLTS